MHRRAGGRPSVWRLQHVGHGLESRRPRLSSAVHASEGFFGKSWRDAQESGSWHGNLKLRSAALPPHTAERLCLSDRHKIFIRGYASILEAQPPFLCLIAAVRLSLTAMCCGGTAQNNAHCL